ncbi:MAG: RNA pyrophosphohydrolase [Gammaproteobacteria bacterium]|nr:RNA pyrophosphohydrolase [Gammaproteobacteria bacterium]
MLDKRGFRLNIGVIIINDKGEVFIGRRPGKYDAWQFPQGGVADFETLEETMYRELKEEVGLDAEDVELLGVTKKWLYYRLPRRFLRRNQKPLCIGQKQKWFLLKLIADESRIRFDVTEKPEFSGWKWVSYWLPIDMVISFKRMVYKRALKELYPLVRKHTRNDK